MAPPASDAFQAADLRRKLTRETRAAAAERAAELAKRIKSDRKRRYRLRAKGRPKASPVTVIYADGSSEVKPTSAFAKPVRRRKRRRRSSP